jgi:hypothetical protein
MPTDKQYPTPPENTTDGEPEQPKRGRPLKYQSVDELDAAIQAYFDMCDPHQEERLVESGINANGETIFLKRKVMTPQKAYTMSGLARALGISRQTLLDYSERDEFLDSIEAAKHRCEEYWEGLLASPFANGAKFNLINNYKGKHQDWTEKQVVSGDPDAPSLFNPSAELTVKIVDGRDNPQPEAKPSDPAA